MSKYLSEEEQRLAVKKNSYAIKFIDNPPEEAQKE